MIDHILQNITAIVTVLIPPAMLPGEPPIIIRIEDINFEDSFNLCRFIELNPAVLKVTD
jgi:hypothetical protein